MSLDLYVDPLAMVDEISALGLRHVGYGVPTELFQPLVLAYVEALKCTKCWKTSFFSLLFQGICWFLRVDGSQHQLVFQAVASGEFAQEFSLVTRTMNLTSATSLTAGNLLSKRSLKKSSGKSKDDEPMSRWSVSENPWYYQITLSRLSEVILVWILRIPSKKTLGENHSVLRLWRMPLRAIKVVGFQARFICLENLNCWKRWWGFNIR